ncbi:MAG: hypothetical protein HQL63_06800 [Magnetococcales bacterium]|nr:hypothetical protein [Magnetococcales bacterium]
MPNSQESELNKVADQLVAIRHGAMHDDLGLQRHKRRAEAAMAEHPAKAHNILGTIATIRRDEGAMRNHFRLARLNDPWDPAVRVNHVASLQDFGCLSEAAEVAIKNCEDLPRNPELLCQVVESCVFAGRLQYAAQRLTILEKFKLLHAVSGMESLLRCSQFLAERGVGDQEVESLQNQATALLRKVGVPIPQVRIALESEASALPPHDRWVSFSLIVPLVAAEVEPLQQKLHRHLLRSPSPKETSKWVKVGYMTREQSAEMTEEAPSG